ncbi:hypothetical protein QL285_061555 [Trifolium repens]|nr:hypothetical protein QL285_061555 [Trifolium repens]
MTRTAKGCLIFCLWFFYAFVWIWWWCWCGFGCAHWCLSVLFRRNYLPLGGAVRVRCQYLSPKLRDFSPLRRCFCDVSFDTMCVATPWLRDRFVAALGCCFSY